MFSYEGGVGVAFLFWIYSAISLLIAINSRLESNLKKIGQRLSWLTQSPKSMEPEDLKRSIISRVFKYLFVVGMGLPFIFLSWATVFFSVAFFLYSRMKDSGAPEYVRTFRWKMRNIDMSFDEILKELMKVEGRDPATFEQYRQEQLDRLVEIGLRRPVID